MMRRLVFFALVCCAVAAPLPSPARAVSPGAAVLDIDCDNLQGLTPARFYGGVSYLAQASNPNAVSVVVHPDGKIDFSDPDVAIVTADPGCTGPWWCVPGVGSAHCDWAWSLYVDGADGNDVVRVDSPTLYSISGIVIEGGAGDDDLTLLTTNTGFVRCGAGNDRVTATANVFVGTDCETVTRV
jgi:hypothetical protein